MQWRILWITTWLTFTIDRKLATYSIYMLLILLFDLSQASLHSFLLSFSVLQITIVNSVEELYQKVDRSQLTTNELGGLLAFDSIQWISDQKVGVVI